LLLSPVAPRSRLAPPRLLLLSPRLAPRRNTSCCYRGSLSCARSPPAGVRPAAERTRGAAGRERYECPRRHASNVPVLRPPAREDGWHPSGKEA